jgi:4-amino-4-deoxy-L-arabinose transferase-like glycosyltransferase
LGRRLTALLVAGLAVRLAWMLVEPSTGPVADERTWLLGAIGGLAGRAHFNPVHWPQLFYPPLYPYMLAAGHALGGMTLVTLLQVLASSLLIPPVGRIGARLFGESAGTCAAACVAFYPEFVWHSVHFWAEPLYVTLLFWAFERALSAQASGRARSAAWAGVLFGLATLTREPALYFTPVVALWLAWRLPRLRGIPCAAAFVAATLLALAPWTLRNWLAFRAFVPVSIMSGRTLWEGNTKLTHEQVFRRYRAIRGPDAVMRQYRFAVAQALENIIARQPFWFFEKVGEQMPRLWAADNMALIHMERGAYGRVSPQSLRRVFVLTVAPYALLAVLFLVSVCRLRPGPGVVLLLGFLLYYCLVHVAVHGHPRFRLPVTPVLMLMAAGLVCGRPEVRAPWSLARAGLAALLIAAFGFALVPGLRQRYANPAWGFATPRPWPHGASGSRGPEGPPATPPRNRHRLRGLER